MGWQRRPRAREPPPRTASAGIVCVDGGWLEPCAAFDSWEACEERLAPPRLKGLHRAEIEGYIRGAHPTGRRPGSRGRSPTSRSAPTARSRRGSRSTATSRSCAGCGTTDRPRCYAGVADARCCSSPRTRGATSGRPRSARASTWRWTGSRTPASAGSRATTTSTRSIPVELADVMLDRSAGRVLRVSPRPRGPRDHGLGRDGAHDGQGPPRAVRPVRGEERPRRRSSTRRTASRRTRTSLSARTLEFFATSVGNPVEVATFRVAGRGRGHGVHGDRPDPRRARTSWQGRAARATRCASGRGRPSRTRSAEKLAGRRHPHDGERGRADAGRRDDPGLRDLQGGRGPALARGAGPARRGDGAAGGGRPPLRQRRGRQPRHPLLLHGRAPAAGLEAMLPGGLVRPRRGQPHGARAGPRGRASRPSRGSAA